MIFWDFVWSIQLWHSRKVSQVTVHHGQVQHNPDIWGDDAPAQQMWGFHQHHICCLQRKSIGKQLHYNIKMQEDNSFSSPLTVISNLELYRGLLQHNNEMYGATFDLGRTSYCCFWMHPRFLPAPKVCQDTLMIKQWHDHAPTIAVWWMMSHPLM